MAVDWTLPLWAILTAIANLILAAFGVVVSRLNKATTEQLTSVIAELRALRAEKLDREQYREDKRLHEMEHARIERELQLTRGAD